MPQLTRPALRDVRTRIFDSARWANYQPRPDDIVIATFPKCGTTWTQRIVSMLVSASADPTPIASPWFDMRMFGPVEEVTEMAEAQTTRRFLKSHLPYDALPVYEGVKFIHVARDGRDAAMSMHNHSMGFRPESRQRAAAVSLADPKFGDVLPPPPEDPAEFFHEWLRDAGALGDEHAGFFELENSYWSARRDPNVLLVHYNDLKADSEGEIRRMAGFLDIDLPEELWPKIIEAAGFETMREQGDVLMPFLQNVFDRGAQRFIFKGTNGRWRGVFRPEDLARYNEMVAASCSPTLAAWLEGGRLVAGDPVKSPD